MGIIGILARILSNQFVRDILIGVGQQVLEHAYRAGKEELNRRSVPKTSKEDRSAGNIRSSKKVRYN